MIEFVNEMACIDRVKEITANRQPDFNNLLKVLAKEKPNRPTLFEFFLNSSLYNELADSIPVKEDFGFIDYVKHNMLAYRNAGYDFFTLQSPNKFYFPQKKHGHKKSISLNEGVMITDRDSFEVYPWPNIDKVDLSYLDELEQCMIPGMKAIPWTPGGVLENVTSILGYDNLCYLLVDDAQLLEDVFQKVGESLLKYYEKVVPYSCVGAAIVNDDWGFHSQTMLKVEDMRKYVIPWHKKFVDVIHQAGKPAILHSCGQLETVMDDIIDDIGFDAKHSYEDKILSVEQAYEKWGSRIAILGGLDVHFVCTVTPKEIFARANAMLELTQERGGYALGTGNSVPDYVPKENYYAMILAALFSDR